MRKYERCGFVAAALVTMAGLGCVSPSLAAKPGGGTTGPSYQIIELDSRNGALVGTPFDVNKDGLVVGGVTGSAACWTVSKTGTTVTTTLYLLDGDVALGVSDAGEIVGADGGHACYWENRLTVPLPLPVPADSASSQAMSINGSGVICGWVVDANGIEKAVAWRVSMQVVGGTPTRVIVGPHMLPLVAGADSSKARAVNGNDVQAVATVVGEAWNSSTGAGAAVAWEIASGANGSLIVNPLPTALGADATATAVNAPGTICGYRYQDAVVWIGDIGRTLDRSATVSAFGGRVSCTSASALGVNAGGLIVGDGHFSVYRKAVVWPGATATMILLDKFLTKSVNITELNRACAVNDSGVIVGTGWDNNRQSQLGFVAIPK